MKTTLEELCPYIDRCDLYYKGCDDCETDEWYKECWNYKNYLMKGGLKNNGKSN